MQLGSFQKIFKTAGIMIVLLVVLVGTIFLGRQASTTFLAKATSCPAAKISAVQVTANSAVISWETMDVSQGRVEYGTNTANLAFSAPEATSGKTHNIPLTLLTPNTVYYYLITIGSNRCDSSGQACNNTTCIPWSFTTTALVPQQEIEAVIPTPTVTPAVAPTSAVSAGTATPTSTLNVSPPSSASGGGTLSTFCQQVEKNIGETGSDTSKWASVKQYDIDGNGFINSMDVIKCQKSGK